MVVLIVVLVLIAGIWTLYDRLWGKPKPTAKEWRTRLEGQLWFQELKAEEGTRTILENDRGVKGFLANPEELQRLVENENAQQGFAKYIRKQAGRTNQKR